MSDRHNPKSSTTVSSGRFISRDTTSGVFRDVKLPRGDTSRVMDRYVFDKAVKRASRTLGDAFQRKPK